MSTEIALTTTATFDQIAQLTGQQDSGPKSFLPRLKINRDFETDDGKQIPPGTYMFEGPEGNVYSKKMKFRPYINSFQYSVWDEATKKYPNKTIIFKSWQEESIDELGGVRCGKIVGKAKANLTEAQAALQKNIRCYRNVYGTVTMTGTNTDGAEVIITEEPCLLRVTGSAFTPVGDALEPLTKSQRPFFTATLSFSDPERAKKGATIYYIPVVKADLSGKPKPIDAADIELLQKFQSTIDVENEGVISKYKQAHAYNAQTEHILEDIQEAAYIDNDDLNDPIGI